MRVQFERFDQAINHMSHGLCAVDADHRIVLFNSLFLQMYGLSNDVIRVGAWMRDVIDEVARRGYFPNATPEQVWQRRLEKMASGKPFQQRQTLRNGRDYILHYHPMADGGWVTLCEDVTERHRMEQELRLQYERFDQAREPHVARAVHVRPGRTADRLQRALPRNLWTRSRGRAGRVSRHRGRAARIGSAPATSPACRSMSSSQTRKTAVIGKDEICDACG